MIVTTDNNKQFVLDKIEKVLITFTDGTKVTLNAITDFEVDLDTTNYSEIDITNALFDKELQNHFKSYRPNKINGIFIDGKGINLENYEETKISYTIPCDMYIRRLRLNSDLGSSSMRVVLEGEVN